MPSYPQFPRSNVPGKTPNTLTPGSFATNWADGKMFVGGPTGVPQLIGYPLRNFSLTAAYRQQDCVVFDGRIWQCRVGFVSPGPFNSNDWLDLTEGTIADAKELASSVLLSGGGLSAPDANTLNVGSGSGIQMDVSDPDNPQPLLVSWGALQAAGTFPANATLVAAVTGAGALLLTPVANYRGSLQRTTIRAGVITTDTNGALVSLYDAPRAAYQTRDTLSDLLTAIGPFKVAGLELSLAAPSALQVTSGEGFWATANWDADPSDPNVVKISGITGLSFRMVSQTGYQTTVPSATVDTGQWDNAGVMQAVPVGQFTNQFIMLDPNLGGISIYGQATYATLVAATDALSGDWQDLVIPGVARGQLLLGALTTNGAGTSQLVTSSNVRVGTPFGGGGGGGEGDLSSYLLINGTRPMTGSLNLGGNGIINGEIDGADVALKPVNAVTSGAIPAGFDEQITTNTTDDKIYLGSALLSQRLSEFDTQVNYKVGDLTISGAALFRCTTEVVPPGGFNPSNWEPIGDASGDLTGALIKAPTTATRNQVDLNAAGGGATAFSVNLGVNQSVNVADFGPRASVNRFGVPVGSFGGAVFVVSQATHGFTAIGTAVYFNGLNWVRADSGAQARFPNAVVAEIIDANTVTLQTSGRITGLSTAAFEGGVITPGTYYYASPTPGLLTATPGATPVPVLYTLTGNVGLIKLTGTAIEENLTIGQVIDAIYPVGSLYMGVDPDNPATRWPGTTWVAHAAGRAIVGVGNNGTSDWAVNQQRGAEAVTLSAAQIPAHNHTIPEQTVNTSTIAGHAHGPSQGGNARFINENVPGGTSGWSGGGNYANFRTSSVTGVAGEHFHTVEIPAAATGDVGNSQSHDNVQPSIGVFVWRRTA